MGMEVYKTRGDGQVLGIDLFRSFTVLQVTDFYNLVPVDGDIGFKRLCPGAIIDFSIPYD